MNSLTIRRAKELIEDTIRRNASPVLDFEPEEDLDEVSSMSPVDEPEYSYTIHVGGNVIRISGSHLPFVQVRLFSETNFMWLLISGLL